MAHRTPLVQHGVLVDAGANCPTHVVVDTPGWFTWLANATAFRFVDPAGAFTARLEPPSHGRGSRYWKAYRRRGGQLCRVYLGASDGLTLEYLRRAAAALDQPERTADPGALIGQPDAQPGPSSVRRAAADGGSRGRAQADAEFGPRAGDVDTATIDTPPPALHLRLLGEFRLSFGDEWVVHVASVRLQALLAYLALHRDAPRRRQQLAFLFWPDATEAQAHNNLRQLVHQLRRVWPMAERYLTVGTSALSWRRGVNLQLDVAEFDDALTTAHEAVRRAGRSAGRAALERAVGLYSGELLPGCYEDWLASERERLAQRYRQALDRLLDLLEEQRDYRVAIDCAQQRLSHDQLDEETYRRLMRLHALNHDRASALRVFHACASMLEQELTVEPSSATRELYERLMHSATVEPAREPALESAPPLVGRQSEWTQLRAAWERAADGEAHLMLITGDAGIGKSRLAEELVAWAGQQGVATARTRAYAGEGRLSYAPVVDWLRSRVVERTLAQLESAWRNEVARLVPELMAESASVQRAASASDPGQRQRLFEALARAVLGAEQPVLLLLDDVQWCDQDTLEWLHYLLRFDRRARLLVVATARLEEIEAGHPVAALVVNLRGAGQLSEIALGPLDAVETMQLAAHTASHELDPIQSNELYRETEGNPLFVVEAVRAGVINDGWPAAQSPHVAASLSPAPDARRLPPKVHAVITARLAQLSQPTRELAGLAATIGRAFTLDVLAGAYAGTEDSLIRGLDELWRRRLVRDHATKAYDFTHDKIREVAYAEVTPAHRRVLHRRVAQALERVHATNPDPVSAQLGAHYERAAVPDKAVRWYQRAAAVAQRVYGNEEAVTLLNKGLTLLGSLPTTPDRDERELALHTALGVSLVAIRGYGAAEVVSIYRRARELSQGLGQPPSPPMLRALAIEAIAHTEFQQAHDLGDHLLSLAERDRDPVLLVEAHYVLGVTLFWKGAFLPARAHLEEALGHYDPARSPTHIAAYTQDPGVVCLVRLAVILWFLGHSEQAVQRAEESLVQARRVSHPFSLGYALAWNALLHTLRGDAQATLQQADAAIALSREHGLGIWLAMGTVLRGWALAEGGAVKAGINVMREGMADLRATGSLYKRPLFLALLAEQYTRAGDLEHSLSVLNEALAAAQTTGERCWEAELYRRQGELLHKRRGGRVAAEEAFRHALGIARYQGARAIELRVANSLTRLGQPLSGSEKISKGLAE